jgi:hypothetical protein
MDSRLNHERAPARQEELLRLARQSHAARRRRLLPIGAWAAAIVRRAKPFSRRQARRGQTTSASSVDLAGSSDEVTLRATSAADPVLMTEVGGVPVLALSIADGSIRAFSDELPLELLELAQLRASQLRARSSSGGREPTSRRHFRRSSDADAGEASAAVRRRHDPAE